jgi:adenine-specific DNA glycosylase
VFNVLTTFSKVRHLRNQKMEATLAQNSLVEEKKIVEKQHNQEIMDLEAKVCTSICFCDASVLLMHM